MSWAALRIAADLAAVCGLAARSDDILQSVIMLDWPMGAIYYISDYHGDGDRLCWIPASSKSYLGHPYDDYWLPPERRRVSAFWIGL